MQNDKQNRSGLRVSKGVMLLFMTAVSWLIIGGMIYLSRCLYHQIVNFMFNQ